MKHRKEGLPDPRCEREWLQDVTCDKCGKSCLDSEGMNFEYAEIKAHWGYMSGKDLESHTAQVCEKCYDEIVAAGLKPKIEHYM